MPDIILRRNNFRSSTKLEALIKDLRKRLDAIFARQFIILGDKQADSETKTHVSAQWFSLSSPVSLI